MARGDLRWINRKCKQEIPMNHPQSALAGFAQTRLSGGSEQMSGKLLADLFLHQTSQELDIVFVGKTSACVDLQSGESEIMGQADLQDSLVTL